jgi:nucleoid-associated protein YgaU
MELKRRFAKEQKSELIQIEQSKNQVDIDLEKEEIKAEEAEEEISAIPSRQLTYKRHTANPLVKIGIVLIVFAGLAAGWHLLPQRLGLDQQATMVQPKQQAEQPSKTTPQASPAIEPKQVPNSAVSQTANPVNSEPKTATSLPVAATPEPQQSSEEPKSVKPIKTAAHFERVERHTVATGETLYRISMNYYRSGRYTHFLADYNRLEDPASLTAGNTILIPFPPDRVN